jgi:transaldolase/glucose-6-phosphate isomerase
MNALLQLAKQGQSVWLDYIRRSLIGGGTLKRLIDEDGLKGVTSNPSIFEKAIDGSKDYDDELRSLLSKTPREDASALYDTLAIEDVRAAADVLRPVYDASGGADGFVSIEPPPQLTRDTGGTVAEARRIWRAIGRPNVMIKVVGSRDGVPAVETLIAEGINVNITLIFSLAHYEAVADAYLRGVSRCAKPAEVASVASVFVSRIDNAVDRALEEKGSAEALALRGKIAVANARLIYKRFHEIFHGDAFRAIQKRGARVQRPLWASTSTKNPDYRDVLYVEELIGPETVNTIPPATMDAFRDHGQVRGATIVDGMAEAEAAINRLPELGIDLGALTARLQIDGIASFASAYDRVLAALEKKRELMLAGAVDRQEIRLDKYKAAVDARLERWHSASFAKRLWAKDGTLWSQRPIPELTDRMGWLDLPASMPAQVESLTAFGDALRSEGVRAVVLLGMGGSSLAPEVFARTFGNESGRPALTVLDSTHPAAVEAVGNGTRLSGTAFIVSSKSGTTTETLSLFRYFWQKMSQVFDEPGSRFIAITDPGTPLEKLAHARHFRKVFPAPPDVGGRYSALSVFGLVPAAIIGVDLPALLERAARMAEASAFCVPAAESPGLTLGAALGEMALAGRDKITFLAPPALAAFPVWAEQLIAESTGKNGKGIVPVVDEPEVPPDVYGSDRLFVQFSLGRKGDASIDRRIAELASAGHPTIRIALDELPDLGEEYFRWEVAVAAAGAVLGINPFNQPDVQLAKDLARKAMEEAPAVSAAGGDTVPASEAARLASALNSWLASSHGGDYVAIQAYLAPTPETTSGLQKIRSALLRNRRLATTSGYGPRFLHSTGQLHKGGPDRGLFLQLVDEPRGELAVPETSYTFGALIRAQALGDYHALQQRGRRVLRVSLGADVAAGLGSIAQALDTGKARRSGR